MTQPMKLSELLQQRCAERLQEERNVREAEQAGAHREFSDGDDKRGIIGDQQAAKLLSTPRPLLRWDCEVLARRQVLEEQQAETDRKYKKLMHHGWT